MAEYREGCAAPACAVDDFLGAPHLRVQLSPPGQPWAMLRFCDLICLSLWLDDEAQTSEPTVFLEETWIDSHG